MKILIDNRTKLNNEEIGIILDDLQEREKGTTQYFGKWKGYEVAVKDYKILKVETIVMKKYFKVLILEKKGGRYMVVNFNDEEAIITLVDYK